MSLTCDFCLVLEFCRLKCIYWKFLLSLLHVVKSVEKIIVLFPQKLIYLKMKHFKVQYVNERRATSTF
jgi:hypothetical protein